MQFTKGLPREAKPGEYVALDIEIFGQQEPLHKPTGEFACLSVAFQNGDKYQLYDKHDLPECMKRLKHAMIVMQNAQYDLRQLARWCTIPEQPLWDTMIMEQGLYGGYFETFSLDALALRYLGTVLEKEERRRFSDVTKMDGKLEQYAIKDAWATIEVMSKQQEYLTDNDIDPVWYWEIDMPMIWTIMDFQPIYVDVDGWMKMAQEFQQIALKRQEELGFNVQGGDVKDRINAVLKGTGISQVKDTNAKFTLEPLMDKLRDGRHTDALEFLQAILDVRMYRKAASTYGVRWIEKHVDEGGLVVPDWKIVGAETGRMACREPNIQNIPARRLPEYRYLFKSQHKRGTIMVSDVAQQEPRITAYFSKDANLLKAFQDGIDIHQWVADEVGCERNPTGKAINLGLTYGLSEYGLARNAGIPVSEAKKHISVYFRRFRGVRAYINKMRAEALRTEKVFSATGRPVWMNIYQSQWQNNAINNPIQSTAADHTKLAVVKMRQYCKSAGLPFNTNMIIHDEAVSDNRVGEVTKLRKLTEQAWIDAGEFCIPGIPMKVDIKSGSSWGVKQDE
jgi:DNA polymerase-1